MALVVTIVVLIILATISISAVFSDNGIIKQAEKARDMTANSTKYEEDQMKQLTDELANAVEETEKFVNPEDLLPSTGAGSKCDKPSTWTSDKVTPISDGSGNAIPLPNGFYYVGGNRTDGLVISDNSSDANKGTSYATASTLQGNQFVWIPVDNEEALTRTYFDSNGQPTTGVASYYTEPYASGYSDGNGTQETADFNTMKTQVLKYGGFYIGRYEAGDATAGTTLRTKVTTDHTVVSKKGIAPYNYIPWGKSMNDVDTSFVVSDTTYNPDQVSTHGAVYLATNMYTGKEQAEAITSGLLWGCQWDAMCRYIGDSQRTTPEKDAPELTGSVETDMSKNIYDLAGNCWEWTMETFVSGSGAKNLRGPL